MRNPYYEIIKDDLVAAEDKGQKEGREEGKAERKKLEERIKFLEEELKKTPDVRYEIRSYIGSFYS